MKRFLLLLISIFTLLTMTSIATAQQTTNNIRISFQVFERGYMIWRADTGHIWVFGYGGQLLNYPSSSYARLPNNPIQPAEGQILPIFGFGKVWGNNQAVRDLVGFPQTPEGGGDATYTVIAPSNVAFLNYDPIFSAQIDPNGHWVNGQFNSNIAQVTSLTATPTTPRVRDQITLNWQSNGGEHVQIEIYDATGKLLNTQTGQNSGNIPIIMPDSSKITVMVWAVQLLRGSTISSRLAYSSLTINITGATVTTPAPPPTSQTCASGSTYIVQRGDTLYGIARRCGVTLDALASRNNIVNRNRIFTGQRLIIP
jgi:LysM repeat protein